MNDIDRNLVRHLRTMRSDLSWLAPDSGGIHTRLFRGPTQALLRRRSRLLLSFFKLLARPIVLVVLPLCTDSQPTKISGDLPQEIEHFGFAPCHFYGLSSTVDLSDNRTHRGVSQGCACC